MKNLFARTFALIALASCSFSLSAEEENNDKLIEETVALARSYLGESEKLDAVKTLKYEGVLVYGNGQSGTVSAVYKKPLYQQFTAVINNYKEVSTLNRTEAWRKVESVQEPGSWSLDFYKMDDIHHMQASVREALSFLGKPQSRAGRIEYAGTEEVRGRKARVLVYYHTDSIWFRRYIDAETGKALSSVNDKGVVFEEHGEKIVNGIRFPEKLVTRFSTGLGEQTMELSYTSIVVNGEVDDARFKVPAMTN